MAHNYRVNYAFEHLDSETLPENKRFGFGYLNINTDKEPETQEEFDEIAKTIGRQGNYKSVAIQTVTPIDEKSASDEVIEGEIIID